MGTLKATECYRKEVRTDQAGTVHSHWFSNIYGYLPHPPTFRFSRCGAQKPARESAIGHSVVCGPYLEKYWPRHSVTVGDILCARMARREAGGPSSDPCALRGGGRLLGAVSRTFSLRREDRRIPDSMALEKDLGEFRDFRT